MMKDVIYQMLTNIKQCPQNKCSSCVESVNAAFNALSQIREESEIDNEVISELRATSKDDKEKLYAIIRDQQLTIRGYARKFNDPFSETEEAKEVQNV
jgi:hypothetical protein